ncbi:synapse-associated protein of 47 kDa [Asbolus verrucosus]|uniref:Synapse-associated protein of 47 kDa n=1 Tax=Asbolus verrucosus TaxID=1661398 RepID=A0A482W653_ASBVE|nr:synapse-associated protein of 47 kDa [Asbolus verrucosus]
MFSGLTNQVTSWMGTAKGEQEEKVPTPTEEGNVVLSPDKKDASPTKQSGGSRLDMLTNVKSQIEGIGGWLGSSIPKLRKGEEGHQEGTEESAEDGNTPASAESIKGSPQHKDDDDNSSATGGADSGPQSIAETPTEEKEGQFGNVQSKALAGAKSFGNFLYSAVNKAGKTSILGEFNKEQEAFVKGQAGNTATSLPPWTGCSNEEALKEECLSLSTDKRNFVRSPPAGVDFQFDYEVSYPVAMAIMEQDPNLEKMRYELVPKVINEENFWRNYFYRVSLICQANELSFMSRDGDSQSATETVTSDQPLASSDDETEEFVSDSLQASSEDFVEVAERMMKMVFVPKPKEEWERELVAELHDYEVVSEQKPNSKRDIWEQEIEEIEEMLKDGTDLK